MKSEISVKHSWVKLGLIWGVWTLAGLFYSSQQYLADLSTNRAVSLPKAMARQMFAAYVFALATPFVLWLARRFRIDRRNWRRSLPLHLLFSVVFGIIVGAIHITNDLLHMRGYAGLSLPTVARYVFHQLDMEMLVYWIIVLASHALDYYNRYRDGELRAAQLESRLSQAQLQALKMQLNPHFLFNTLNAISELVYDSPATADRVVTQLSEMLRLSLKSNKSQEVSLKDELEFLERYIEIQQTLLQERLTVRFRIDAQTLDARVPNMILQPLVENAIQHGLSPRAAGGKIEIGAQRENGMLHLYVQDDGLGITSGKRRADDGKGIGLSNTRARLRHLYAERHRFELKQPSSGGVVVHLAFPFRESRVEQLDEDSHVDR
ncbi:MAG: histidine kinase [Pyrinomonadaceae bacterium]|nr:histidine kinase [Pyrinomonadaceae bacterium]